MPEALRADLHVHSYHSGYNEDLPFLRSRDCYADPEAVYRTAKARGMDLVTITDHDSIDGCLEFLSRHPDAPDFIIGEEITCWTPAGRWPSRTSSASLAPAAHGTHAAAPIEVHLAAYGMTARAHREIQPLRRNVFDAMAYLRDARIFFALNHLFHFYKSQVPIAQYLSLLDEVPALETRNGAMLPAHNRLVEAILARRSGVARHAIVAGSDAHTLRRVGRTWTSVPARTRDEFLRNLAAGHGRAGGDEGGTLALAGDIYGVIAQYWLSLAGLQRHELTWPRRAFGAAFSLVSAPFEFTPLVIAALKKRGEARRVRACEALLDTTAAQDRAPSTEQPAPSTSWIEESQ